MQARTIIGVFNFGLTGGGTEHVFADLVALMTKWGHRVIVFTERVLSPEDDFCLAGNLTRVILPQDAVERSIKWRKTITEEHIDVIVYHQYLAASLPRDCADIKEAGAAICVIFHSPCFGERYGTDPWNATLTSKCYPRIDAAICLSPAEALWWGTCLDLPVFYIPNPVPNVIDQKKWQSDRPRDVVWVGRFAKQKRLEDAIQAFAGIAERVADCRLIVLGSSSIAATDRIYRRLARRYGIEHRVVFAGKQKNVGAFFETAALYLQTSVCESFSLTLAESKAHGVPAVMYDLPYLVLGGSNTGAVTVELGNIAGLAEAMTRILKDDTYRDSLGEQARQSLGAFDEDRLQKAWARVFSLLRNRASATVEGDLARFETPECYRLVLEESMRSWYVFMAENAWKLKVADWIERHVPVGWLKKRLQVSRPDLFPAIDDRTPEQGFRR